jgi:hypothetical protein
MFEFVHQYAPTCPACRMAIVISALLIGIPSLSWGLSGIGTTHTHVAVGIVFLPLSGITVAVAGQLIRGLIRQPNNAPVASLQDGN